VSERVPQKIQFRPRARIIRTIGDQLISGPEAAVIELVKNSYDADASFVVIKFQPPLVEGGGRIVVKDDGHGMTVDDIQEKWMEPATSSKVVDRASPKKGRRMLGYKGIGRFAAAKLGRKMELSSISDRTGERIEVLISEIDWSIFTSDAYLSDISIEFLDQPTTEPTGTTIEIFELNEGWSQEKVNQLFLELRKLVSPLHWSGSAPDFRIFLDLSECTPDTAGFDGAALVGWSGEIADADIEADLPADYEVRPFELMSTADYEVDGWFEEDGTFEGTMEIKRAGQSPQPLSIRVPFLPGEESCGRVQVKLSIFDREADVIRSTMRRAGMGELTATKARQLLDEVTGVAIYRDGFRVRPYGDLRNDWLTLDTRRVQDPSLRIGHNQVAGYIGVEPQDSSDLIEKSSREGFEENGAFVRLRRLVQRLFAEAVEPRRQTFREAAGLSRKRNTTFDEVRKLSEMEKIRELIIRFPPGEREKAEQVIDQQSAILADRIEQLQDRQRLLEAKSSLGLIVGEILHEGAPSANFVATSSARLKANWNSVLTPGPRSVEVKADFPGRLDLLAQAGVRLRDLFQNLRPLAGGKRGAPIAFNVVNAIRDAAKLFEGHKTFINLVPPNEVTELIGYREDFTTALVNLFANGIHWLEDAQSVNPRIDVRIAWDGTDALVSVEDNGPGIPEEFVERVFDIRFTLKDGGTGLGLNIAQEALARSGGKLFLDPEFEPGARFEIRFPRYRGPQG